MGTGVDVLLISGVEEEQGLVAYACECEDGFLAVDFHFAGVFEGFVEGAAEGVGCCGGGDDEVTGVVGAG